MVIVGVIDQDCACSTGSDAPELLALLHIPQGHRGWARQARVQLIKLYLKVVVMFLEQHLIERSDCTPFSGSCTITKDFSS